MKSRAFREATSHQRFKGLNPSTTSYEAEMMGATEEFKYGRASEPEDPPVGTQILNYCDSYDPPGEPPKFDWGWRRDGAGRLYRWIKSPYMKAIMKEDNGETPS